MERDSEPQTLASKESNHDKPMPLFFIYDCEGTGGSVYTDHIIEIAAAVQPLSAGVFINSPLEFQTLVHTSKIISAIVSEKCGLKTKDLLQKPKLSEELPKLLKWIKDVVQEVRNATNKNYSPAILAHNGFVYDYPILMAEINRSQELTQIMLSSIYFGDTLEHIRKLKSSGSLAKVCDRKQKVGMEALYETYFPSEKYQAHRALEDVRALKRVVFETEIKDYLENICLRSFNEQKKCYSSMMKVRVVSKYLLLKFGKTLSRSMAKKLAHSGWTYNSLRGVYKANPKSREDFMKALTIKKLSKICQNKLANHFYGN